MTEPEPTKAPSPIAHRRDEGGVRADEGARADLGPVLVEAVVIAGDGAGADIGLGPDRGIAEIGEVVDLGAGAELGVLDLDEIADLGLRAERRARPQAREGADAGAGGDRRAFEMAEGVDDAPSATSTPGPKTTCGSTITSAPEHACRG